MFDAGPITRLLEALAEGDGPLRVERVLEDPDLALMFPAVGVANSMGLGVLTAVKRSSSPEKFSEEERTVFAYFSDLAHGRTAIERLCRDLAAQETRLISSAFTRTREWLPSSLARREVRVVPLPLGYDFRTDGSTLYMDPLAALEMGTEGICETWAHELHHIARYWLTGVNLTLMRPEARTPPASCREAAREGFTWMEAEGIADCVSSIVQSKAPLLRAAVEQRREQLAHFEDLFRPIADRLVRAAGGTEASGSEAEALGSGMMRYAHPLGFRMADAIRSSFGGPELISCVGEPLRFAMRYGEAAARLGLPRLDSHVLEWLRAA